MKHLLNSIFSYAIEKEQFKLDILRWSLVNERS